jgi:hypothetical protein
MKGALSRQIFKRTSNFTKIRPLVDKFFHPHMQTEGQTGMTNLIDDFHNFANASKKNCNPYIFLSVLLVGGRTSQAFGILITGHTAFNLENHSKTYVHPPACSTRVIFDVSKFRNVEKRSIVTQFKAESDTGTMTFQVRHFSGTPN